MQLLVGNALYQLQICFVTGKDLCSRNLMFFIQDFLPLSVLAWLAMSLCVAAMQVVGVRILSRVSPADVAG